MAGFPADWKDRHCEQGAAALERHCREPRPPAMPPRLLADRRMRGMWTPPGPFGRQQLSWPHRPPMLAPRHLLTAGRAEQALVSASMALPRARPAGIPPTGTKTRIASRSAWPKRRSPGLAAGNVLLFNPVVTHLAHHLKTARSLRDGEAEERPSRWWRRAPDAAAWPLQFPEVTGPPSRAGPYVITHWEEWTGKPSTLRTGADASRRPIRGRTLLLRPWWPSAPVDGPSQAVPLRRRSTCAMKLRPAGPAVSRTGRAWRITKAISSASLAADLRGRVELLADVWRR